MKARFAMFMAAVMMALGLTAMGSTAPASAATVCPSGHVCVYYGTTQESGIKYAFYTYGAHNIYNMVGDHLVVNNQTGGAYVLAKSGANGTGRTLYWMVLGAVYQRRIMNLTPVWSIGLYPPCKIMDPRWCPGMQGL